MDRLAGLDRIAGLLGWRLQFWLTSDEPLHHVDGGLQVRQLTVLRPKIVDADPRRFPFPLTNTYVQLLITHALLILVSSILRFISKPLHFIGLGAAVPPSQPAAPQGGAYRMSRKPGFAAFVRWLSNGSGGIAGGGLFEFDWAIAKQVQPLAVVYMVKVLLSNYSFA